MDTVKQTCHKFEPLMIHCLTGSVTIVHLLVYGMRLGEGLLSHLRPVFGVPYASLMGALLIGILAINNRWKSMVVVVLGEMIHALLLMSPIGARQFTWNEYINDSVLIACLLVSACLYYRLVDE